MKWPEPVLVWKAVELFLGVAYDGPPPSAVRARLDTLRGVDKDSFFDNGVFERKGDGNMARLYLRLGNRYYPHMKMAIERRPDHRGFLFRADTHDAHCCPVPGAREYAAFRQLMEVNQTVAQAIEAAWEREGVPTFKTYLREDLARRQQGAGAAAPHATATAAAAAANAGAR